MPEKKTAHTVLWLVRHGQTDWNLEGRYQGQADPPLNRTGIAEAGRAAGLLAGLPIHAVYTSDLRRARHTAEMIARAGNRPVLVDPRLREIRLGEWEGQLFSSIQARYPAEIEERERCPLNFRPPGGETLKEVWRRVRQAVMEIEQKYPGQEVVLVSHGLVLGALLAFSRDGDIRLAYRRIPANAAPERVEWQFDGDFPEREDDHAS